MNLQYKRQTLLRQVDEYTWNERQKRLPFICYYHFIKALSLMFASASKWVKSVAWSMWRANMPQQWRSTCWWQSPDCVELHPWGGTVRSRGDDREIRDGIGALPCHRETCDREDWQKSGQSVRCEADRGSIETKMQVERRRAVLWQLFIGASWPDII